MIFIKQSRVQFEMKNSDTKQSWLWFDKSISTEYSREDNNEYPLGKKCPNTTKANPAPYSAINPTQNKFAYPFYLSMCNIHF